MPDQPLTPVEIGRELAALRHRQDPRMSAAAAGSRLDVAQSTITRWESGRFLPDEKTMRRLCALYGADDATRDRLINGLLARAERSPQVRLSRPEDAADRQMRWADLERDSKQVTSAGVTMIPGLLQSEAYMRAVVTAGGRLSGERLEQWVVARLWRQRVLTESGRTFIQLICPGALVWCAGSRDLMADQLDALVLASRLPSVRLGVIPPGKPVDVFPLNNADHYVSADGTETVIAGHTGGTAEFDQPLDIEKFTRLLNRLAELAVYGDEARAELERASALYR